MAWHVAAEHSAATSEMASLCAVQMSEIMPYSDTCSCSMPPKAPSLMSLRFCGPSHLRQRVRPVQSVTSGAAPRVRGCGPTFIIL